MDFETVIGLEVHVQLATASKIFFATSAAFGAEPNTQIDPVTLGMPGALPVFNKTVADYAIMLGLATKCEIRNVNRFARKHYFYPDLPKGYQISQFEEPICERGQIVLRSNDRSRTIGITRIHMEEDAGKSLHFPGKGYSLVDLNRAGVPLLEVVSEPDLRSPAEAAAYLKVLRQMVCWLGISDGNMEEGSLRCDANISLRPHGEMKYGTRTEIKNLNSFRFVEKALEYEIMRQYKVLKSGGTIVQETLLFDTEAGVTRSMRGKEGSADYRYFPDPDLPPLVVEDSWIAEIRQSLPVLPEEYFVKLTTGYGLNEYDAGVLTADKAIIEYFEKLVETCRDPKLACNWITSDVFGRLNKEQLEFKDLKIPAEDLGRLVQLVSQEVLSGKMARVVFDEMFETGKTAEQIIEEKGLKQNSNEDEIRSLISGILDQSAKQVGEFQQGSSKVIGFFVGQVMKATGGTANPKVVNKLLMEELKKRGPA